MALKATQKQYYLNRADSLETVGLPRDHLGTAIQDPEHQALAELAEARQLLASDDMPLPAAHLREGYYGDRHHEYWLSGLLDCRKLQPEIGRRPRVRVLDFGGCSGRVMRHAARLPGWECWLCDINVAYVDWLAAHATRPIRGFASMPWPHLPFPDARFDAITAFSVFTHIDALEIAWLLELKRVLRPDGLLYVTVLDEFAWSILPKNEWFRESLSRGGHHAFLEEALKQPQPERLVLEYNEADAYNCNVVFRQDYLRRRWGQFFGSVEIRTAHHAPQSVVLLRP